MIMQLDFNVFMDFINNLTIDFNKNKDISIVKAWENYMKNNFQFLGIKTNERRIILKKHWLQNELEITSSYRQISWELFQKKEREFHYCGQEILINEIKNNFKLEDIVLIEKFITTNSWWDTVDFLAKYLLGNYLIQFPEKTLQVIEQFSNSTNMWLNRSAIIFQLTYKEKTNFELLKSECEKHKDSKEFFIQKAIGWALRDYSRFNPIGVKHFVENTNLKPLSKREALRKL